MVPDTFIFTQIIFNGHRLLGGIHDPNDPLNTYKSLDGLTTYVLSGGAVHDAWTLVGACANVAK